MDIFESVIKNNSASLYGMKSWKRMPFLCYRKLGNEHSMVYTPTFYNIMTNPQLKTFVDPHKIPLLENVLSLSFLQCRFPYLKFYNGVQDVCRRKNDDSFGFVRESDCWLVLL